MESLLWHTVQQYPPYSEKVSSVNKLPILLIAAVIGLSACSAERISNFPSYKLKVIQGNQLDARAVSSLQQGMSRDQVQLLLGTPLLRDPSTATAGTTPTKSAATAWSIKAKRAT